MIRPATAKDLDAVYRMGYDAWSGGKSVTDYLEACRASKKYKTGTWYVLDEGGQLLSSLIVYRLDRDGETAHGIGSIATVPDRRRGGAATMLIVAMLALLDPATTEIYLHSDIGPDFYERFGFRSLPEQLQRRHGTTCMLRCSDAKFRALSDSPAYRPPDYF